MLECTYRAFSGRLLVKFDAEDAKDIFAKMGGIAAVLDSDQVCGCCKSEMIYPNARQAQGFIYFELQCAACEARLSFGQRKDGGLWAKRDDHKDTNGWYKYLGLEAGPSTTYAQPVSQPRPMASRPTAGANYTPPRPSGPDDTRLQMLLAQAKANPQAVYVELCGELDALFPSTDDTNKVWESATANGASPEAIIRHLYAVVRANQAPATKAG